MAESVSIIPTKPTMESPRFEYTTDEVHLMMKDSVFRNREEYYKAYAHALERVGIEKTQEKLIIEECPCSRIDANEVIKRLTKTAKRKGMVFRDLEHYFTEFDATAEEILTEKREIKIKIGKDKYAKEEKMEQKGIKKRFFQGIKAIVLLGSIFFS